MNSQEWKEVYEQNTDKRRLRRIDPTKRTWEIKRLWSRQHEILNRALLGMPHKQIAQDLGITPVVVSAVVNSSMGKRKLDAMRATRDAHTMNVMKEAEKLAEKAMKIYERILDGGEGVSLSLQKGTADTIVMDILGNRAPAKVQGLFGHLSAEDIEGFKQRGMEAAMETGMVVGMGANKQVDVQSTDGSRNSSETTVMEEEDEKAQG